MTDALEPEDRIYRRLLPTHYVPDGNQERMRPSSAAFERRPNEAHASCYIDSLLVDNGLQPADVLDGQERLGLVRVGVDCLRDHGRDAAPDPDTDPDKPHKCDPAHGKLIEPTGVSKGELRRGWGRVAQDSRIEILKPPG